LNTITWDSVSHPSHDGANLIRVTESTIKNIQESVQSMLSEGVEYKEENGLICTAEGICYLPDTFDRLVERRVLKIRDKFKL